MKKLMLLILCVSLLLISGCSVNTVKLASEREVKAYVHKNFGDAEYLRKEETDKSITYYFKDEQFKFEYYVMTCVSPVGMDGSVFWYKESKVDNFYKSYYAAIVNAAKIPSFENDGYFSLDEFARESDDILAYVCNLEKADLNEIIEIISEFSDRLMELDNRNFLKHKKIIFQDKTNDWIGRYMIYEKKYITEEVANFEYYANRAESIMGVNDAKIDIVSCETMPQKDVKGLSHENVAHILGCDYEMVTCYYFKLNGIEYFITDICVMYGNSPKQYIYNITEDRSMVTDFLKDYEKDHLSR